MFLHLISIKYIQCLLGTDDICVTKINLLFKNRSSTFLSKRQLALNEVFVSLFWGFFSDGDGKVGYPSEEVLGLGRIERERTYQGKAVQEESLIL